MKVHFFTRASRNRASCRIRAWQIVDAWNHPDVTCSKWSLLTDLDQIEADVVVLQKPKSTLTTVETFAALKARTGCRLIWDISDPEWCTRKDSYFHKQAAFIDEFVMSTMGLQWALEADLGIKSVVIKDRFPFTEAQKVHQPTETPILVWFGMYPNRDVSLAIVIQTLFRLAANHIPYRLKVIDERPDMPLPDGQRHIRELVTFKKWTLETIEQELLTSDVALLPAFPGAWGAMKSWNKPMTAAWAGLPTTDGQDYLALKRLLTDTDYRAEQGRLARAWAEKEGNIEQSVQQWKDLLGWTP